MKKDKTYIIKRDIKIALAGTVFMSLFVFITNPFKLPILMIILVPIMIGFVSVFIIRLLTEIFFDVSNRAKSIISNSIAVSLIIMIMLGSLKQLTVQDITLVLIIVAGVSFYLFKSNTQSITLPETK